MSYDLYVERPRGDAATQIRVLVTRDDAILNAREYVQIVHGQTDRKTKQLQRGEFNRLIQDELNVLQKLGIRTPGVGCFNHFPLGSWLLQFTFTLAKPWISKDDDPIYVAENVNPVRKDKVFKVPMMSAAAWKGLLRWTMMYTQLVLEKDDLSDDDFARKRFRLSLLFGDEKGEEPGSTKDFTGYLDLLKVSAKESFRQRIKGYFLGDPTAKEMPHHSGRLNFCPTFFDLIDVKVINPHSRKTKAGTHPIYFECVPAGARGTFSLLYVPFDLIGRPEAEIRQQAAEDLHIVAESLQAMFLTYGFSAKRTSGYGTAQDEIVGVIKTCDGETPVTHLERLAQEVKNVRF